jgi:glycosyltransferase involved in cell wall biosynthesis
MWHRVVARRVPEQLDLEQSSPAWPAPGAAYIGDAQPSQPSAPTLPAAVQRDGATAPALPEPLTTRGLSVVLPAYNEEAVIADTVARCVDVLETLAPDYQIIVVDDGSRDRTGTIAEALAATNPRITVVHNRPNRGYGGALISGFNAVKQPLAFFMDADGQFDIHDIALLLPLAEKGYRAVLGYRKHRKDPPLRIVIAWGWNLLVSLLFGLRVRDVDCAFKLYDTALVRVCDIRSEGAMVNTEMLVKLSKLGVPFVQVPVRHYPRIHGSATGANPRVIVHAFRELLRLRRKLRDWNAELPPPA